MSHQRNVKVVGALNDAVTVSHPGSGLANIELQVTGAFVGTVGVEVSQDAGVTWDGRSVLKGDGTTVASLSAAGIGRATVAGDRLNTLIRGKVLTYTSGTPSMYLVAAAD